MQASDYTHCIANTPGAHLGMTPTHLFQFGAPSKACDLCSVDQAGLVLVLYTVKKALKYLENEHQVSAPPSQRPVASIPHPDSWFTPFCPEFLGLQCRREAGGHC